MTKDLEDTLRELGPSYRAVVARLAAGDVLAELPPPRRAVAFRPAMLLAASVVAMLGAVSAFLGAPAPELRATVAMRAADAPGEYRLAETRGDEAVMEMIRTQNADGSWQNDFLTRRNAAVLAHISSAEARVAYKKAMRNLRVRGLL